MAKAELGILLQDLRGKAGNAVFQGSRDGLVVRPWVAGSNPNTPAQQAVRANLAAAGAAWRSFSASQVQAWLNYSKTITKHNRVNGKTYHPTPFAAFVALATKFLQVNPGGTIPTTPPTSAFTPDGINWTVTPDTGKITFTPSAANSTNTTTEFLLQPLANANRKPQKKSYKSYGFHHFSNTTPFDVNVGAGTYAVAIRYVNSQTGQESAIYPLETEQVMLSVSSSGKATMKKAA